MNTPSKLSPALPCGVLLLAAGFQAHAGGVLEDWEVSGWIRQYLSWNLEAPYLGNPGNNYEPEGDYRHRLSMARTVGKLNLYRDFGRSQVYASARIVREHNTGYLRALQRVMDHNAATDLFSTRTRSSINLIDDVYDQEELRELWWQVDLGKRTTLKLGKQQVVWGETDFFQSMDVIHGYDLRWRSFLEPENEEVRKPLWMLNLVRRIGASDASVQLLYIPGRTNSARSRGNNYDVEGGRWANHPNKGLSFAAAPFGADVPYNHRHHKADMDDDAWGLRWKGMLGEWEYSLGWFHGPAQVPVINPNPANPLGVGDAASGRRFLGAWKGQYGSDPDSTVGELIYPFIHVFGVSANRYLGSIDAVFSGEMSFIPDNPYNIGIQAGESGGCAFFPGFCGIMEKDVIKTMLRIDKQLSLQSWLGTSRPSFFSLQLFNTWISDYKPHDELVNLAGFSGRTREFSTLVTAVLSTNYKSDRINPSLAVGGDLTYGGGFVIPSVELAFGNHWRLRVEADLFWNRAYQPRTLSNFNDTNLFGYFHANNQLLARLTWQF